MTDKTPGQIAYEAWVTWKGYPERMCNWAKASPEDHAKWDFIGQAVAQAVAPVPEP